jgi:hypothetical protein
MSDERIRLDLDFMRHVLRANHAGDSERLAIARRLRSEFDEAWIEFCLLDMDDLMIEFETTRICEAIRQEYWSLVGP